MLVIKPQYPGVPLVLPKPEQQGTTLNQPNTKAEQPGTENGQGNSD